MMGIGGSVMFPDRLKNLRTQKGVTQEDVAKALGVSRAAIAGYESGKKREPDYETLSRIADYFRVSVDYLLGRTDDPTPLSEESLTPQEYDRRVVAALSRSDGYGEPLTKEEIEDILKYIRWTRDKHRMGKEKKSDS
jgi:transcriptional regulator with XRE-family HTH domain